MMPDSQAGALDAQPRLTIVPLTFRQACDDQSYREIAAEIDSDGDLVITVLSWEARDGS